MQRARALSWLFAVVVAVAAVGLFLIARDGDDPEAVSATERPSSPSPSVEPARFTSQVDNPFLPLVPGTRWVYEGDTEDGRERIVVEVTGETRRIMGVDCVVVRDTVTLDGEVTEDTFDWYAQDDAGAVWYFGEDTTAFEDGVPSKEGSWEAGVDGAEPGIAMEADPQVGDAYRQEYLAGEAEDHGEVLSLDEHAAVPFGTFDHVLMTEDTTPLEPDVVEHKYYARGIGVVLEVDVAGGSERVELVELTGPGR
jgi:hypothetical protein